MAADQKAELAAELDRARAQIARYGDAFRHDVDVPAHLKKSIEEHKGIWIGAASMLGLLIAKLPRRTKKVYVDRRGKPTVKNLEKAGLALAVAKMAFSVARPALMSFATKQVSEFARRRSKR